MTIDPVACYSAVVATYAAVVATVMMGLRILDWWQERPGFAFTGRTRDTVKPSGQHQQHALVVNVTNKSKRLVTVTRVGLTLDGSGQEVTLWDGPAHLLGEHGALPVERPDQALLLTAGMNLVDILAHTERLWVVDSTGRRHTSSRYPLRKK